MKLIDTHCHLDDTIFDSDRDKILQHCSQLGINKIILPATKAKCWHKTIQISENYKETYLTLGLHPLFISEHINADLDRLKESIVAHKPVAVGEIGLDFFIKNTDKTRQTDFFVQQLDIAQEHKLPVVLHVRKAHDEILKLLKEFNISGGSCHAFNGTLDQAKRYIDLGFKLGFGGTMTYPNARKIHQLAKDIAIEHILLETDAPDMTGHAHKGERNSPEYLVDALNSLAEIKSMDVETIADQTTKNAEALFKI